MKTPDVTAALGDKKLQLAIYSATGRMADRRLVEACEPRPKTRLAQHAGVQHAGRR